MDNSVPQQPIMQTPPMPGAPSVSSQQVDISPFQKYKKLFLVGGVGLVIFILIIGTIIVNRSNPEPSNPVPSEMDALLAAVGNREIYKSHVWREANKQYAGDAINDEVITIVLNSMIEREILDLEAEKLGVTVTDSEISAASSNATNEVIRDQYKYSILKEKIMAAQVESVQAFMIGFWVRPLSDPHQLPIYAEQRRDGLLALTEAEVRLRAGDIPVDIASSLYEKYPSLQPIWAFNGYLMISENEDYLYTQPRLYTFDAEELEALKDNEVYDVMREMKPGEVRRVLRSNGSGGVVMQVTERTTGEFADYNEFFETRKSELVRAN